MHILSSTRKKNCWISFGGVKQIYNLAKWKKTVAIDWRMQKKRS